MEGGNQPQQVQNVTVTQVVKNRNDGGGSGCAVIFVVLLLVGAAIEYWYIAVPIAVLLLIGGGIYLYKQGKEPEKVPAPAQDQMAASGSATPLAEATTTCEGCGAEGLTTLYCPNCGAAQHMTCAGCGRAGLTSAFCPACGSATYKPPAPV